MVFRDGNGMNVASATEGPANMEMKVDTRQVCVVYALPLPFIIPTNETTNYSTYF